MVSRDLALDCLRYYDLLFVIIYDPRGSRAATRDENLKYVVSVSRSRLHLHSHTPPPSVTLNIMAVRLSPLSAPHTIG